MLKSSLTESVPMGQEWNDFLKRSINQDCGADIEDETAADIREWEDMVKLLGKHKALSINSFDKVNFGKDLGNIIEDTLGSLNEFTARNVKNISKADPEVKTAEFLFGPAYSQFIQGKASDGFKLLSLCDNWEDVQTWITKLAEAVKPIILNTPDIMARLVSTFVSTKIGLAEAQAIFMYRQFVVLLTSDDFWDAILHKNTTVTVETAVKLLTVYCMDATLWMSSPFGTSREKCGKIAFMPQEGLSNLRDIRYIFAGLAECCNSVKQLLKRRNVVIPDLNALKSAPKSHASRAAKYLVKLAGGDYADDSVIINSEGKVVDVAEFDPSTANLAVFALSDDYLKLEELTDKMIHSRVPPTTIDLDLLATAADVFLDVRASKGLGADIMHEFMPTRTVVTILEYTMVWLAHIVRFNTLWKSFGFRIVKQYLKDNVPEFEQYSKNPVMLIKKAIGQWQEEEKRQREEQEREAAERVARMKEAAAKLERERLEAIEKMESERKGKIKAEGFQLASDSGRYEKWFKENTCRIFFKTTSPEEKKGILVGLEELGISASKVRNIKNPAGIIRTLTIGEDEIYSDSLIESALHKAARFKPEGPVFNTEVVSTAFDLVFDKTFFELEWLDKAIVRAMDDKVSIQDARYCTKVMRDRGIIGQIKGKKNGPKIFALTPEGYSLYQIQKDYPNLPILAVPWEKYIGEEVAERLGTLQYFDITTRPVKDIDKMIAGKTPRFLDKYYVTAI